MCLRIKTMSNKERDSDLQYGDPKTIALTVRLRDIFDECKDSNKRWLPGLLIEEMYNYGLIDEFQQTLFRREIGL